MDSLTDRCSGFMCLVSPHGAADDSQRAPPAATRKSSPAADDLFGDTHRSHRGFPGRTQTDSNTETRQVPLTYFFKVKLLFVCIFLFVRYFGL